MCGNITFKSNEHINIMKHNTFLLSVLSFFCLILLFACEDETGKNLLKLDKESITLNQKDAMETITVTSGAEWEVVGVPEWIQTTPLASDRVKEEVTIRADENDTFEQRTATLIFTNGHISRKLEIIQLSLQEADAFVKLSVNEIEAGNNVHNFSVDVITNRPWELESAPEWVQVSPRSGEKSTNLSVTFNENFYPDGRNGELTFVAKGVRNTLKLSQIGLRDISRSPHIPILRASKFSYDGKLTYCDVENNYMFVNPTIKNRVFLGNLLSHNIGDGVDIPQFTGYTFKPITVAPSNFSTQVDIKTFTPSLAEQTDYAQEIIASKPKQMDSFLADNGTTEFYSYRLLHAIGMVNFGIKLDEVVTGQSYAQQDMEGKYGLIYSFRQSLFSLLMDFPEDGSVIHEKLKDADKGKGVSYVASVSYGKVGLLVVETGTDSRKVKAAINKFIGEYTLQPEETALIESAGITYVYFDNNNQMKTVKGGVNAVEAYRKAATTVDYDNIYPITFQLADFFDHTTSKISYSVKIP